MDQRLVPINGLIALLRGDGGWPDRLGQMGLRRHQLEVPITSSEGDTRADALLYRLAPDLILLCECKSGKNVDRLQIAKYIAVTWQDIRRPGLAPPQLADKAHVAVATMIVGNEGERADLEHSLTELGTNAPLLTVGPDRVRLSDTSSIHGLDDFDIQHRGGLPPARIPVDHQSPDPDIVELLIQEVVAAQASLEDIVPVEMICSRVLPEWSVISHGTQGMFIKRVAELLENLSRTEMQGQFRYERLKQVNTRGRIVIEQSPATKDPRGRTQAFQAQQRRAGAALQRAALPPEPRQLSIDELAYEGGLADE